MSHDTTLSHGATTDPYLTRLADAILIPPFPGLAPPRWFLEALDRGLAGVTLFGLNVATPEQVTALTEAMRSATSGADPVIAIDEEGGDVTRISFAEGSPYPGNAALGVVDDPSLTRSVYHAIGADLAALGVNVNLSPVADVLGSMDSPAIGTRSFGTDTELVSRHTVAAVTGLQAAGVAACVKHFPGHGRTGTDSHKAIATIEGTMEDLRRHDLPPFAAAISAGVAAVMPSHLRLAELTGDLPATVSTAALTGLLREEMGYSGVIISDALEMRATSDTFGIPAAAVLAVAAGTDLLCLGRDTDEDEYKAVRDALVAGVRDDRLAGSRLEEAADRVAALRASLGRNAAVDGGYGDHRVSGAAVGLTAARRASRLSGPRPALVKPLIIEVEPGENIAAGPFAWGLSRWAPRQHPPYPRTRGHGPDPDGRDRQVACRRGQGRASHGADQGAAHRAAGRTPGHGPGGDGPAAVAAAGGNVVHRHLRRLTRVRPGRRGAARPGLGANGRATDKWHNERVLRVAGQLRGRPRSAVPLLRLAASAASRGVRRRRDRGGRRLAGRELAEQVLVPRHDDVLADGVGMRGRAEDGPGLPACQLV